jgi:beta-glucanase (GH16 family)
MTIDQDFPVSIEAQFLGGDGTNPRTTMNLCTPGTNVVMDGKLFTPHCVNAKSETFHGDQWVLAEAEVRGGESITHYVNGVEVLRYDQPQLDERDANAQRLLAAGHPKLITRGTISLQSESHPIQFRRVELLPR